MLLVVAAFSFSWESLFFALGNSAQTQNWSMCGECVTIEYSAPKQNAITKVQGTFWKWQ